MLTYIIPGGLIRRSVSGPPSKQSKVRRLQTMTKIYAFLNDESGATAIEYGLLAALISIAALAAMKTVGTKLSTTFSKVGASL